MRLGVDKVAPKVQYKSSHMGPERQNSFKEGSRGQQYEKMTVCDLQTEYVMPDGQFAVWLASGPMCLLKD